MQNFPHALAGLNGVFSAINAKRRLTASEANPTGFLAQHVDLLTGHGRSIRLHQPGIFVHDLLSTPGF
ncbi:MAG: hypothetical protein ABIQ35_06265 [Verrucomicrobiota bacterium]